MNKFIQYIIIILAFISFNKSMLVAQVVNNDTTSFEHRQFNQERLEEYRAKEKYDYTQHDDVIKRFLKWVGEILRKLFNQDVIPDAKIDSFSSNFLGVILVIVLIVIVIVLFSNAKFRGWLTGKGLKIKTDYTVEEEDIHDINFDLEIMDAEKEGNFRRATRLLFLKVLKKLDDSEKITWDPYKTNYEYKYELNGTSLYKDFTSCMSMYEDVWYGEKPINAHTYTQHKKEFEKFNSLTSKTKIAVFNE